MRVESTAHPKWRAFLISLIATFALAASGFFVATRVEENDTACASCHSQPETTYFDRTQAATTRDLASAHAHLSRRDDGTPATRCIDCHSGPGLLGRVQSVSLGARDAFVWFSGRAAQLSVATFPIQDANCLKCHTTTPNDSSFDLHFHRYMTRWQQADANAGTCAACHTSHTTDGNAAIGFLQQQRTLPQCKQCHVALGVNE